MQHLFEDVGYTIQKTSKGSILEQTINLFGGIGELNIIANKDVFNLLVALTPKIRMEKVVKKLLSQPGNKIDSGDVLQIIAEIRDNGAINFPSIILTAEDIVAKTTLSGKQKKSLFPIIEKLYNQRIFLRGKYFECQFCKSKVWLQIDEINRVNYCVECSNIINIPVFLSDKQDSDYFRLNHLIVRAVDQGQLSTILLLNLFYEQKYRAFNYQSNLEIYKDGKLITDIDLLIKIGKKIGIVECKSNRGISEKQVDELIAVALSLQCDFIAFSSLVDHQSQEIIDLSEIITSKSLAIPAFIFTNEVLFNPKPNLIRKYFELLQNEEFISGPIIVKR
jgi:hypothetical protein